MITCREFVEFLMDYLEGSLPGDQVASFEFHLSECLACVNYMKTYQQAIRMGKMAFAEPDSFVPAEVPEDLVKAILEARRVR